jgi:hypothetical protein
MLLASFLIIIGMNMIAGNKMSSCFILAAVMALLASPALACTNMLVDPSASADGSSIIAYNADSATVYGMLYHYPAADHAPNTTRDIYNWDSGAYLGSIAEASHTFNVVGNTNEYGVTIGETTFGGISLLGPQVRANPCMFFPPNESLFCFVS